MHPCLQTEKGKARVGNREGLQEWSFSLRIPHHHGQLMIITMASQQDQRSAWLTMPVLLA